MSRMKVLPDDVKQVCIHLAKGYGRRVQDYNERRTAIIDGRCCDFEEVRDPDDPDNWKKVTRVYQPKAHYATRVAESVAERLLALEDLPDTKYMRAVEQAQLRIGLDLPEELRRKLVKAIMLNCSAGRRYPFECLDVEGIERTDFYNRRTRFLAVIAGSLGLI